MTDSTRCSATVASMSAKPVATFVDVAVENTAVEVDVVMVVGVEDEEATVAAQELRLPALLAERIKNSAELPTA